MKRFINLSICLFSTFPCLAQSHTYTLSGEVKPVPYGTLYLLAALNEAKYYGKEQIVDSTFIRNGRFSLKRVSYDNEPRAFKFIVQNDTLEVETGLAFIEPGNQYIIIDSLGEYAYPLIRKSKIQQELREEYGPLFKKVAATIVQMYQRVEDLWKTYGDHVPEEEQLKTTTIDQGISKINDSLFNQYTIQHPDSYIILWKLIGKFENSGYKNEYSTWFNLLSEHLKQSITGKLFAADLKMASQLAMNRSFPKLLLKDTALQVATLSAARMKARYTLVDFWYSSCVPCRKQFPKLKELYNAYKERGFDIFGISIDKRVNIGNWKKLIKVEQLPWPQYLDEEGKLAKQLIITSFPTNYLINGQGVIIRHNISLRDLETLLKKD